MYNYNTLEGKMARVEEIKSLVSKIGEIPGNYLSYLEARKVSDYLIEVKKDLEKQIAEESKRVCRTEKWRYYFVDEDIEVYANSGDEAMAKYHEIRKEDPTGRIELTNLLTGYQNVMMPIKIG